MKRIIEIIKRFDKYSTIIVFLLSIISVIVMIISFIDTKIIDSSIYMLANNSLLMVFLTSFLGAVVIVIYLYLIRKMFMRRKVDVFLSYANSSNEELEKIKKILLSTSNYKLHDFDSISIGENIQTEIKKMIDNSKLLIIIFDDVYFQSNHCQMELKIIINSNKNIIPILKSNNDVSRLPPEISKLKYLVISNDKSWERTFEQSLYVQYRQRDKQVIKKEM